MWNCKRCGHYWRPRIENPPAQCPHCKSPYWSREKRVAAIGLKEGSDGIRASVPVVRSRVERKVEQASEVLPKVQTVRLERSNERRGEESSGSRDGRFPLGVDSTSGEGFGGIEAPSVKTCPYREYDPESGETMGCGLRVHSGKVKHGAWRKL